MRLLGLERDPHVRQGGADGESDQDAERRAARNDREEGEQERAPQHQVGELDRAQRHVGPFEQALELQPEPAASESPLGRAEEPREGCQPLALLLLLGLARAALDVRGEAGLDPRALGRAEHEAARGQDEEGDQHGQEEPAERRVERRGEDPSARTRLVEGAGNREVGGGGALGIERDAKVQLLARARGRHVLDPPRPLELRCHRGVDPGEGLARGGRVEGAAGLAGERLQRLLGLGAGADRDGIDEHAGLVGARDRLGERCLARDVLAVGEEHDDPGATLLLREQRGREHDRVVQGRAGLGVHGHRAQRVVGVDRRGREGSELHRRRAEDDDGHPVGARLGGEELAGGGCCVVELLAGHRAGAVDGDDDALRGGEVQSGQVDDA